MCPRIPLFIVELDRSTHTPPSMHLFPPPSLNVQPAQHSHRRASSLASSAKPAAPTEASHTEASLPLSPQQQSATPTSPPLTLHQQETLSGTPPATSPAATSPSEAAAAGAAEVEETGARQLRQQQQQREAFVPSGLHARHMDLMRNISAARHTLDLQLLVTRHGDEFDELNVAAAISRVSQVGGRSVCPAGAF
ncbi:MAG: hypothetical protein WDW36_009148 [Sanguina aurantia]